MNTFAYVLSMRAMGRCCVRSRLLLYMALFFVTRTDMLHGPSYSSMAVQQCSVPTRFLSTICFVLNPSWPMFLVLLVLVQVPLLWMKSATVNTINSSDSAHMMPCNSRVAHTCAQYNWSLRYSQAGVSGVLKCSATTMTLDLTSG